MSEEGSVTAFSRIGRWCWPLNGTAKAVLLGQFISLLIAGTGVFATILADNKANFPLLLNLFNYFLLSMFLVRKLIRERSATSQDLSTFNLSSPSEDPLDQYHQSEENPKLKGMKLSKWLYLFAAFLDVEANFLVLLAYNYTNITSIMLLDCFTIPCVMTLSYFLLGCRYRQRHGLGVVLCIVGLVVIVVNDVLGGNTNNQKHALVGDLLCIGGSMFYASSNVIEETMVKYVDKDEYLGYVGSFGVIIAFVQCMIFDLSGIQQATFTPTVVIAMVGFVLCLFFMYTNTTSYLQESDATLFNLSLLTSDVYAVIFTYFFDGYLVSWLYFLAFALVIAGLLLYHSEKPPLVLGKELGLATDQFPSFLSYFVTQSPEVSSSLQNNKPEKSQTEKLHFQYNPILDQSTHRG
jgi:solute carrier family 35 protein F1/2